MPRRGWTIIELLVTAAVLCLLAALILPAFYKSRQQEQQYGVWVEVPVNKMVQFVDIDEGLEQKDYYLVLTHDISTQATADSVVHLVQPDQWGAVESICRAARDNGEYYRVYRVVPEDISPEF